MRYWSHLICESCREEFFLKIRINGDNLFSLYYNIRDHIKIRTWEVGNHNQDMLNEEKIFSIKGWETRERRLSYGKNLLLLLITLQNGNWGYVAHLFIMQLYTKEKIRIFGGLYIASKWRKAGDMVRFFCNHSILFSLH